MKIEYICHACLFIETEDARIATDPWWAAPVFCDKWYVFPKPVNTSFTDKVDAILISHGHEDHLNEPTLSLFSKDAKVFYPYSYFGGAREYIEGMGFDDVRECVTFKKYRISEKTEVTFIINSHDSVMVIESGGKVVINANDALHSSSEKVIAFYVNEIKKRWPKVDVLFCGFGGASYFPNTMHLAGKDDYTTSLTREQLFVHNFCSIVKGLHPAVAVPFAADFCLIDDDQRWINDARFPRAKIAGYYRQHFAENGYEPQIADMYSGDRLEGTTMISSSPYRSEMRDGGLHHLVEEQYKTEIVDRRLRASVGEDDAESLCGELLRNVKKRMTLFPAEKLRRLKFSLRVTDVQESNFYNLSFPDGVAVVNRSSAADADSLLVMELSSAVLRYSIGSDWGADVICVGYGAEIHFADEKTAEVDLESICMNLLACYPTAADLKKAPFRTLQFLLLNPPRFTTSIRKLKKFNIESENYDRKTWLLKKPSEIRRIYNLPELGFEFQPQKH